jgi:cytochrome c-type biogenesis protein CcmH/NrfF
MNTMLASAPVLLMLLGYVAVKRVGRRRRRQYDKSMLIPHHKIDVSYRTGQFRR